MAYADRDQGSNRLVAIVIVAFLITVLGYAFVTGLAYEYVKKVANKMDTFDVAPPPPPPPPDVPPPPPPPEQQMQPPPVVSPPPIVQTIQPPVQISTVATPPPKVVIAPPPPPPPPAPPRVSKAADAKGNPADWITTDDYPSSALRAGDEGTVTISWTVGTNGRVENCHTVSSSGHSDLDEAACRALTRHARYKPALDQNGEPMTVTQSRRVVWRIPD